MLYLASHANFVQFLISHFYCFIYCMSNLFVRMFVLVQEPFTMAVEVSSRDEHKLLANAMDCEIINFLGG